MKDLTVTQSITIHDAMKVLNRTAENCLLVVDENNVLLGTLTDGDLRRSVLAGEKFSAMISESFNTDPIFLVKDCYTKEEAIQLLRKKKLSLIPIVDKDHVVVDYVIWNSMNGDSNSSKTLADIPVVIMAGGKGSRLEPFTKVLPKPLVPVHEKPIIEHIIERFTEHGCSEFYLTVNYKSKILKII